MRVHYFQRYHAKENVATANTMLLLSRLYSFSSAKFYEFLKSGFLSEHSEPEVVFKLQERSEDSIPDATISQEGFKVVVETKITDWFYTDQLMRHLKSFGNEKNKVLITLSTEPMAKSKNEELDKLLKEYNKTQKYPVYHVNMTFKSMIDAVREVVDEKDYELIDIVNDYEQYCIDDKLISDFDAYKTMRMQLAGQTLDFNIENGVYYDDASRGFRPHNYLGLYKQKSVRAIGKISAIIKSVITEDGTKYEAELGTLTDERLKLIEKCIRNGDENGYDLRNVEHNFFFVEKFYETDYKKVTKGSCMGSRIFDLEERLGTKEIPDVKTIASKLKTLTWE